MKFETLSCPQCAAPLPRQAFWRTVVCPYCGTAAVRKRTMVEAARFHEAYVRIHAQAQASCDAKHGVLQGGKQRFAVLATLGIGESSDVFLAERLGPFPLRVTLKRAHPSASPETLKNELKILESLQALDGQGAAHFRQRLPQPIGIAECDAHTDRKRTMLIMHHPSGYWGSLADVLHFASHGIDPRHAVWIWRRILEVLGFIHAGGWTHGDLSPEHLLVHPRDHGVLIVGWSKAHRSAHADEISRDIMQSAWTIRALLSGGEELPGIPDRIPAPIAELLVNAGEDREWCIRRGAQGLNQTLAAAARQAFGPPAFYPFSPTAPHRY